MDEGFSDSIRVLHVDDEPEFADLAATYLEREDDRFVVETATSAAAGSDRLDDREFDCVVSDYEMPGRDGIEFLRSVRERQPDLPFVLFTGKGSEEVASDAISAGVTDYLQKQGGTDQYTVLANRITNAVEHYRSQRRVERSEERLREIVDALPHLLYVVDDEGNYLLANDALASFHGTTVETIEGSNVDDLLEPHVAEQFHEHLDEVLDCDSPIRVPEIEIPATDDETHVFEPRLQPYALGDDGAVLGIAADVTEQRRRERALREERAFIEQSLDVLRDVFFVFSRDGELLRWNDRIPELTGYTDEEVAGMAPIDFFPADHRSRVTETVAEIFETGSATVQADICTKDGDRIPHELNGTVLRDADGEVLGFAGTGRDITERRAREQELIRMRELLEQSERIADVGGWEIDTETREVFWTEHLFEILGVDGDEEPPLDGALDVYHEEDRPTVAAAVEEALDSGEPFDVEARFRRPNDEIRWLRIFGSPTVESGEVVSLRGAVQDVTEWKTYEQKLRRKNDQLSQFASVVSHDLRNPLNVMEGRLELAREECESRHLEDIERAQGRMHTLIEDLLALAREGAQVGDFEVIELRSVVDGCWRSVATGDARLVANVSRSLEADRSRLQQLLENLVRNAVEHGGGDVTVTVGECDAGFYVEDDGPGIPVEDRDDVFEIGHSTSQEGNGFGLSIVERIADAHGWEIRVTDGTDGGARFEITGVEFVDA